MFEMSMPLRTTNMSLIQAAQEWACVCRDRIWREDELTDWLMARESLREEEAIAMAAMVTEFLCEEEIAAPSFRFIHPCRTI